MLVRAPRHLVLPVVLLLALAAITLVVVHGHAARGSRQRIQPHGPALPQLASVPSASVAQLRRRGVKFWLGPVAGLRVLLAPHAPRLKEALTEGQPKPAAAVTAPATYVDQDGHPAASVTTGMDLPAPPGYRHIQTPVGPAVAPPLARLAREPNLPAMVTVDGRNVAVSGSARLPLDQALRLLRRLA